MPSVFDRSIKPDAVTHLAFFKPVGATGAGQEYAVGRVGRSLVEYTDASYAPVRIRLGRCNRGEMEKLQTRIGV